MRFLPQRFNDLLALLALLALVGLWVAAGAGWLPQLPPEVIGATIVNIGLVFTFYFRKKEQ